MEHDSLDHLPQLVITPMVQQTISTININLNLVAVFGRRHFKQMEVNVSSLRIFVQFSKKLLLKRLPKALNSVCFASL
jgi:hypothetical protein